LTVPYCPPAQIELRQFRLRNEYDALSRTITAITTNHCQHNSCHLGKIGNALDRIFAAFRIPTGRGSGHNVPMPSSKEAPSIFLLNITLVGFMPPVWRRIQVPNSIKLCCLHSAFQVVMG
jgi:Plasmid pRiA4b ORF-3-like protein